MVVFSDDYSKAGQNITLQIKIDNEEVLTQLMTMNIIFETIAPQFDTSKFTAKPITCGL